MPEKKVQKALKIVGIVLLVFVVIFAAAVATLFLRARRRRANHRATIIPQLPVTTQPSRKSITSSSSRGNQQQAARKKSLRERERMNLAFGVVEDDTESRIGIEPPAPTPYNSSAALPMPASSSTMANPYDILIKGVRDPFQDPARDVRRTDKARPAQAEGRTKGRRTVGSGKEAPLRPMRTNGMPRAAKHDPTTSLQHPSPVKKQVSSPPVRAAKIKYESTSSPIKPQRALPTTTKAALGPVRPPRTPLVSQQSSSGRQTQAQTQTQTVAARSGMKHSTSDRSLNAGYF